MSLTHFRFAWILCVGFLLAPAVSGAASVLVSGHVTDAAAGQPVANADVNIWEAIPDPIFNQHTSTDSDGYYQMVVPSAAIVHFIVSATGFTTQSQDIFSVDAGPVIQDFALTGAGSISGEIHATTAGNPTLANVTVSLLDANSKSTIEETSSADDGSYSFQDIGPGAYGICVFDPTDIYIDSCYDAKDVAADGTVSATPIDVVAGSNLSGIDVSLSIGAVMSGTLSDTYFGGPIANTRIEFTLYSSQGTQVAMIFRDTDAHGGFSVAGLAPGNYYLAAGASFIAGSNTNGAYTMRIYGGGECALPWGQSPSCPFATATQVVVPTEGVTGIDFGLFPGYVVKGKVTDANTGTGIPNATINVCDNPSIFLYGVSGIATTDANGEYTIGHAVGAHTYIAVTSAPGYLSAIWPSTFSKPSDGCVGPEHSEAQQLALTAPDQVLTGIDFGLQTGASISGAVTASDLPGEPLSATLNLYSAEDEAIEWIATLHNDANGNYKTPGVLPGTYYLAAYYDNGANCQMYSGTTCGAWWDPTSPLSFDFSAATPVQLAAGQAQTNVNLQLRGDVFHDSFDN